MGNALLTGLSGLLAAERAIATTSHNIANANTEGYSRQSVTQVTRLADQSGSIFDGTGVRTLSIQRVHDSYLEAQLQSVTSEHSRVDTLSQLSNRINSLFIEDNSGLNSAQMDFFNALEDAANNPHAQAPAEHVIAAADELVSRFNFVDGQLASLQSQVNFDIQNDLTQINDLSANIHEINKQIAMVSSANTQANPPSDLMDQRDALLQQLATYVNVTTLPRDGYGIDVAMDNGVPLVTLAGPSTLQSITSPSDPDKLSFIISTNNGDRLVSEPTGGSLGAMLEFGRDALDDTRAKLGQLAAVMAYSVNDMY
ncbi:MAG: flagellar hook-associated protein FlgK, partial [Pseudomonadota bacterium]